MGSAFRSDSQPVFESLETRQLLSVMLDNGLPAGSANYWAVMVDKGGSSQASRMGPTGTNTIWLYDAYLDGGSGVVADFQYDGTDPVQTAPGVATSSVTMNVGGGTVTVNVTSVVPQGSQAYFNFYSFTANGVDLTTLKFWQYMDSNFFQQNSQCFRYRGSVANNDLVLEHVDVETLTAQDQMTGLLNGAVLTGFAADKYTDLLDAMQAGGYVLDTNNPINTVNLPATSLPSPIGACYGKLTPGSYATSALRYEFTSSTAAQITTILGRSLVGGTTISNQLPTNDPKYLAVTLDNGGKVSQTVFGIRSVTKSYMGYLQIGGTIYDLSAISTPPVGTGPGSALSFAMLDLGGGSTLSLTIDSSILPGSTQLQTNYTMQATNLDLTTVKILQYFDPQIGGTIDDDMLGVHGSVAGGNLRLNVLDPETYIKQTLFGGQMTNAAVTGFGADAFSDVQDAIEAGGYNPSSTGTIDTTDLPKGLFLGVGRGYGPGDVTVAIAMTPTDPASASMNATLDIQRLGMKTPIFIVPDVLGSMPYQDPGLMEQFLKTRGTLPNDMGPEYFINQYQPLIDSLETSGGYASYADLYFVGYDWRLQIAPADGNPNNADGVISLANVDYTDNSYQYGAEYLEYWIDQAKTLWDIINPGRPFRADIIAHGMGGLVTRSVLQSDSALAGDLGNVIALGTPNEGEVQPLAWMEAGNNLASLLETHGTNQDVVVDPAATGILATLWSAARAYGVGGTLAEWAPGLKDLLPVSGSYVTSTDVAPGPTMANYTNPLLADLNADTTAIVNRLYKTFLGYGQNVLTMTGLDYIVGSHREVQTTTAGDGVVTVESALLPGLTDPDLYGAYPGIQHRELPSTDMVQRMIFRVLGLINGDLTSFTPVTSSTIAGAGNFVVGFVDPADTLLTDSLGRQVGRSVATGLVNTIPGASYVEDGTGVYFFAPADAQTGDATITLTGLGAQATGTVIYHTSGDVQQQVLSANLAAGQTQQTALLAPVEVALVDNTQLTAADLETVWGLSSGYEFTVTFTNPAGVDAAAINTGDVIITAPDGDAFTPQVVTKSVSADGKSVTVLLRLDAPLPYWQSSDEGNYHINLLSGAVAGFGEEIMGDFDVILAADRWYVGGGQPKQTINLGNSVLTATWRGPGGGWVILNNAGVLNALDIELHDTNSSSCLTLKGSATIDSITVDGSMNMISAPGAVLAGDVDVTGTLKKLTLGDLPATSIGQHTISVGDPSSANASLTVILGRVNDLDFSSNTPLASMTAVDWNDNNDLVDVLEATGIGKLMTTGRKGNAKRGISAVGGDFNPDVNVFGSIGTAQIAGNMDGGTWDVSGSIRSMTVKGTVSDSTVRTTGSMGKIALGASFGNDFLAGVDDSVSGHADAVEDFTNTSAIGSFRITGVGAKGPTAGRFFSDTNVSAYSMGTLSLLNGDFDDPSGLWIAGSATPSPLKKLSHVDTVDGTKWSWPSDIYNGPDDFIHLL